jgi:hypothetical protein
MHQRLPAVAAWICLVALPLGLAIAAGQTLEPAATPSTDAAKEPVHGLLGHYYTRDLPGSYDLKGFLPDEYGIPVPNKQPNAIRVDAQIAFGKGKGFVRNDAAGGSQLVWWAPAEARAAVWKGYIRLPVAGTYYLTTASSGASAVYLNSARVSLNGGFGGSVPSDKFSLGETGTGAANSPNHRQYVVPIPVTGPRVLAIEVRHLIHDSSGVPRGIDLYWVRPDAPRDASGKAVAQIVPTEVLFTQAPEPVDKPKVRGANSMISSDFLYLSAVPGSEATVTVRLADEKGRPVAGHRVHVTTVQSPDGGSSPDEIIQPLQSTDENGIVTAKLRATGDQHGARLFATDLTDFVDVAQVADVIFERRREWSLRPAGFAPYYDSKAMTVEPLPLRVGQPTKLTILLANRTLDIAEVTAAFHARETNIGGVKWDAVGKAERITLAPGESRKVSVTWIPQKPDPHVCFKVDMTATFQSAVKPKAHGASQVLAAALGASPALAASPPVSESLQQNIGPVVASMPCQVTSDQLRQGFTSAFHKRGVKIPPEFLMSQEEAPRFIKYQIALGGQKNLLPTPAWVRAEDKKGNIKPYSQESGRYLLVGSVQIDCEEQGHVRVNSRIVDIETGRVLAAGKGDGEPFSQPGIDGAIDAALEKMKSEFESYIPR